MSDTLHGLSPRRRLALEHMIDVQIQLEDCGAFVPEPSAKTRDEAMHGPRLPVQDGDAVLYPIACRRNVVALRMGNELGGCRWVADEGIAGSVSCTTCGKTEGPGMYRNEELRSMVDGTYMQTPEPFRRADLGPVPDMLLNTSRVEVGGTAIGVLGLEESIARDEVEIRTTVDPMTGDVSLVVVNGAHPDD